MELLCDRDLQQISGGLKTTEVFPNTPGTLPVYIKIFGRWVPLNTEPFYPVDPDNPSGNNPN